MCNKIILRTCILGLSIISLNAWADSGWTRYGIVKELNLDSSPRFQVRLDTSSNPTDCKDKEWFYHDYNSIADEHMYLTLLAGLTTGKKVRVYVTGKCDLHGYSNISQISIIR